MNFLNKNMKVSDINKEGFKTIWDNKEKRIRTKCDVNSKEFNKKECTRELNDVYRDLNITHYGGEEWERNREIF